MRLLAIAGVLTLADANGVCTTNANSCDEEVRGPNANLNAPRKSHRSHRTLAVCRKKADKPGYPSAPSARKSDEILPTAAELPEPGHARVEGDGDGSPDMEATKGDYAVPKLRQMRV